MFKKGDLVEDKYSKRKLMVEEDSAIYSRTSVIDADHIASDNAEAFRWSYLTEGLQLVQPTLVTNTTYMAEQNKRFKKGDFVYHNKESRSFVVISDSTEDGLTWCGGDGVSSQYYTSELNLVEPAREKKTFKQGDRVKLPDSHKEGIVDTESNEHGWTVVYSNGAFKNYNTSDLELLDKAEISVNPKTAFGATKPDLALIPPTALAHEALAFEDGARKYGAYNWRSNSVELMTYIAAAKRHLDAFLDGQDFTPDSNVHNLGAVRACCGIMIDALENGNAIDNRPPKGRADEVHTRLQKQKEEKAR